MSNLQRAFSIMFLNLVLFLCNVDDWILLDAIYFE